MDLLVTYDIDTTDRAGERRLAEIAKVCEGFGIRVQYSVFECRLDPTGVERLISGLADAMDRKKDSVNLYAVGGEFSKVRRSLGRPPATQHGSAWIT